jgi:hypothetical protein
MIYIFGLFILGFYLIVLKEVARRTRLELATPCVTGRYSNQLNYRRTEKVLWWSLQDSNL